MATWVRKSGNNCRDWSPAACLKWIGRNFSPAASKHHRKTWKKPKHKTKTKNAQYRKSLSERCNAISCQIFRFLGFWGFLGFCDGFCIASAVVLQYRMVCRIKRNDQIVFQCLILYQLDRVKVGGYPFRVLWEAPSHTYCESTQDCESTQWAGIHMDPYIYVLLRFT